MMIFHRSPRTYLAPPTAELELQPPPGKPCPLRVFVVKKMNHQGTKTPGFLYPSCLRVFVVKKPPGHQDTKFSLSSCLCVFVVRKE
jgi:hypothetical protein